MILLKLKKESCEVVLSTTYGALAPNIISFAATQGFKPTWVLIGINAGPTFFDLLPEGSRDGIISASNFASNEGFKAPGWKDFTELLKKNNIPLNMGSIYAYSHSEQFVEILKRAGKDLNRASLIKAADSMTGYQCGVCLAKNEWSPTNHWMTMAPVLLVSKGGIWTRLE